MNFLVSNVFMTLDECHKSICILVWHLYRRIIHFINLFIIEVYRFIFISLHLQKSCYSVVKSGIISWFIFFIFMYHISYRIMYHKIHKYYINFIKKITHIHIWYICYKIETYANNDYFNYHLCYSIWLS